MKALIATVAAGLLAVSFAVPADAASSKASRTAIAQQKAACKAEAAKKFSAVHLLKRRHAVNECMGRTAQAKNGKAADTSKKAQPATTGQTDK